MFQYYTKVGNNDRTFFAAIQKMSGYFLLTRKIFLMAISLLLIEIGGGYYSNRLVAVGFTLENRSHLAGGVSFSEGRDPALFLLFEQG